MTSRTGNPLKALLVFIVVSLFTAALALNEQSKQQHLDDFFSNIDKISGVTVTTLLRDHRNEFNKEDRYLIDYIIENSTPTKFLGERGTIYPSILLDFSNEYRCRV